jgi:hypothetical protein
MTADIRIDAGQMLTVKHTKSGPMFPTSSAYFLRSAFIFGEAGAINDSQSLA